MKHKNSIFLFIFAVLIAALISSCDRDCPACPEELPEISQRYLITYTREMGQLVSIDIPADTVIDTLSLDFFCLDAYLHPDNDKIMMLNVSDMIMELYSIPNLEHLGSLDQYGFYYFDVSDSYGLWFSPLDSALYRINSSTLLPVDTLDDLMIMDGAYLDTLSNTFYAAVFDDTGIYKIDCESMSVPDTLPTALKAYKVAYNHKYNELYYIGVGGSFHRLEVETLEYQMETGLYTHRGSIAVSPNNEHVFFTHGGDGMHGVIPPPVIYHYIPAEEDLKVIPADPFAVIPADGLPLFGNIAFTPEGRRVYVSSYHHESYGYVPIGVIDIIEGRMTHTIDMPNNNYQYCNVILTR